MEQPQEKPRTIAALYARDSAAGDNEDSNPAQIEIMRAFCEKNGITPGEEYSDQEGNREEFRRMMNDGTKENPPFQRILVYDMSRFSRSMEEGTECVARLEANGIRVISVAQESSPAIRLAETVKKTLDEHQRVCDPT